MARTSFSSLRLPQLLLVSVAWTGREKNENGKEPPASPTRTNSPCGPSDEAPSFSVASAPTKSSATAAPGPWLAP
jgi:hypothetical protein